MDSRQENPSISVQQTELNSTIATVLDKLVAATANIVDAIDSQLDVPMSKKEKLYGAVNELIDEQAKLRELLDKTKANEEIVFPIVAASAVPTPSKSKQEVKSTVDEEKPKRAASAYLFYAAERRPQLKASRPELSMGRLTHAIAAEWKAMSDLQKQKYIALAEKDKIRYEEEKKAVVNRTLQSEGITLISCKTSQLPREEGYVQFAYIRMTDLSTTRPELTYGERLQIVIAEWNSLPDDIKESYAALDRAAAKNVLPSPPNSSPRTPFSTTYCEQR